MNIVLIEKLWVIKSLILVVLFTFLVDTASADTNVKANKSLELQVDAEFNFNSYRKITLDVSAIDNQGRPIANAIMRIFVVKAVASGEEEGMLKKSLLTMARTDEAGWLMQEIEVPQNYQTLLLEVQNMEVEQQRTVELGADEHLQISF